MLGWIRRFGVLRERDLRLVFSATAVSQIGDGVVTVAVTFAVLDLTHSATDIGIVLASRTIALLASLLVGGVVADRVSRRRVMISADLVRFLSQGVVGALVVSGHATVWEIACSQAVIGAASGFFNPASSALLPAVAGESIAEANAMNGIVSSFGGIVGPAIGGALVVGVGAGSALLVDAASYGASALLLFGVRAHAARVAALTAEARGSFLADLAGGFAEVRSRTWLWATMIVMATCNALAGAFYVLGPVIAKRHLGGPAAWAALNVAFAVGLLIGGTSLLKIRPRRPLFFATFVFLVMFFPTMLIAIPAPLGVIAGFQVLSGAGAIVGNTMWWTVLQQNIPTEALSRVTSFEWFGTLALMPIGFALAGPVGTALGYGTTLYLCGGLSFLISLGLLAVREVRTLQTKVEPPTTAPEASALYTS
ncbi:MAG: MFS transporter [Solirubrobacteraceae bacterium]